MRGGGGGREREENVEREKGEKVGGGGGGGTKKKKKKKERERGRDHRFDFINHQLTRAPVINHDQVPYRSVFCLIDGGRRGEFFWFY